MRSRPGERPIRRAEGLRGAEAARLQWYAVDCDQQVIRVPAGQTKNGKKADLPLPAPLAAALEAIRPEGVRPTDKIFPHRPSRRTWIVDLVRAGIVRVRHDLKTLRRVRKDKTLKTNHVYVAENLEGYLDDEGRALSPHSLRLTFNEWLARKGVDLDTRKKLMRHSDANLTATTYRDHRSSQQLEAVNSILLDSMALKESET